MPIKSSDLVQIPPAVKEWASSLVEDEIYELVFLAFKHGVESAGYDPQELVAQILSDFDDCIDEDRCASGHTV